MAECSSVAESWMVAPSEIRTGYRTVQCRTHRAAVHGNTTEYSPVLSTISIPFVSVGSWYRRCAQPGARAVKRELELELELEVLQTKLCLLARRRQCANRNREGRQTKISKEIATIESDQWVFLGRRSQRLGSESEIETHRQTLVLPHLAPAARPHGRPLFWEEDRVAGRPTEQFPGRHPPHVWALHIVHCTKYNSFGGGRERTSPAILSPVPAPGTGDAGGFRVDETFSSLPFLSLSFSLDSLCASCKPPILIVHYALYTYYSTIVRCTMYNNVSSGDGARPCR